MRRALVPLVSVLVVALVGPVSARAGVLDPPSEAASEITSGGLTVTVNHEPFGLEVSRDGEVLLASASDVADPTGASSPLAFAVGAHAAAQTPTIGYGVFAEADRWIPTTTAGLHADQAVLCAGDDECVALDVATVDPLRRWTVVARSVGDGVVELDAELSDATGVVATGAAFDKPEGERYLGFGERSEAVDQTGRVVENWNEEGPFSAGAFREHTDPVAGEDYQGPPPFGSASNFTMPWFVARSGYGLLLDSTWLSRFHLDQPDAWRITNADPSGLTLRVFDGPTPAEVVDRATADAVIGRQPAPAAWYFGTWFQPAGTAEFRRGLVDRWRDDDVPVTVAQTYTHYLPCAAQHGNAAGEQDLVRRHHEAGYKITTYVNSFVCNTHPQGAYEQGEANGYFVKTAAGTTYPVPYVAYYRASSAIVDFSAEGAAGWWRGLISEALDNGYDGWMEDFGEYVPPDAVLADGRRGLEAHNSYCTDYHRASHQLTSLERGLDDVGFAQFVRCGWTGTAPYARIVWGGDPTEDDSEADGLAAAVNQGLSMGLSGIAYWGSDIGGFHSLFTRQRTSDELNIRWLQLGVFSGIMRTQADGYPRPDQSGSYRSNVWEPGVVQHFRRLAHLRTQLFPYVWDAAERYQRDGLPIMRHLSLVDPDAEAAWGEGPHADAARFEFGFGDSMLVAPVVDMGATGRDVWLPEGDWVDLWDLLEWSDVGGQGGWTVRTDAASAPVVTAGAGGRTVSVDAPLDVVPVFVRAGACVPLLPGDVDTLADDTGIAAERAADIVTLAEAEGRIVEFGSGCA